MSLTTFSNNRVTIPKNIRKEFHLKNGQKLSVETMNNTIHLKPIKTNLADKKLKDLLKHPTDMGKIKFKI